MSFPKIYTVNGPSSTSSATLPSWIAVKQRPRTVNGQRKRTKTQHTVGQLELLQDFAFPEAAIRIKTTPDGQHAMGTGTYKPMVKVWDLEALSVKFERVTDAENVDFVFLSDDWTKTLHLQRDRSISLHTQGGLHHSVRLPTYGRTLAYHAPSADALIGATGSQVYRFSLEEGRFMTPLDVARGWGDGRESEVEGVNVVDVNARHGLWSFGLDGGGGVVEFWDPRSRSALSRLVLPSETLLPAQSLDTASVFAPEQRLGITAMASHPTDGLSLAVGTSSGHTLLYDLRSPTPFAIKDQGYSEPIRSVDWLRGGGAQEDAGRVVSADSKVIKVWSKDDASNNQLSLHPPANLVHLHAVPQSGLLFAACDAPQMSSYYIPELGPAPRWAGFLDNVTDEMGETGAPKGAYTDFKFVDRQELDTLGLTHLVGSSALKPYMHGYFLSLKLYTTARLIANPQSYDEYRDKLVSAKLAEKAESRIRARREQPKVNKALAERLRRAEEREEAVARKKTARAAARRAGGDGEEGDEAVDADVGETPSLGESKDKDKDKDSAKAAREGLLSDPRFKDLWENPEFEVDETSREFALLNPATADNARLQRAQEGQSGRTRTAVESEDEDEGESGDSDLEESDSEEDEASDEDAQEDGEGSESGDSDDGDLQQYDPRTSKGKAREPRMLKAWHDNPSQRTFGQRLSKLSSRGAGSGSGGASGSGGTHRGARPGEDGVLAMRRHVDGGMEMSFVPSAPAKRGARSAEEEEERDEYSGGTSRRERERGPKVERFGAGLEKGGKEDGEGDVQGESRDGRTRRREGGRSGSKNAFRRK